MLVWFSDVDTRDVEFLVCSAPVSPEQSGNYQRASKLICFNIHGCCVYRRRMVRIARDAMAQVERYAPRTLGCNVVLLVSHSAFLFCAFGPWMASISQRGCVGPDSTPGLLASAGTFAAGLLVQRMV